MAHSGESAASSGTSTTYSHPTTPHPSRGQSASPWTPPASASSSSTLIPSLSQPLNEYTPRTLPLLQQQQQHRHASSTRAAAASKHGEPTSEFPPDQSDAGDASTTSVLANLLRLDEKIRDAEAYLRARDEFFGAWPSARKSVEGQEKAGSSS